MSKSSPSWTAETLVTALFWTSCLVSIRLGWVSEISERKNKDFRNLRRRGHRCPAETWSRSSTNTDVLTPCPYKDLKYPWYDVRRGHGIGCKFVQFWKNTFTSDNFRSMMTLIIFCCQNSSVGDFFNFKSRSPTWVLKRLDEIDFDLSKFYQCVSVDIDVGHRMCGW